MLLPDQHAPRERERTLIDAVSRRWMLPLLFLSHAHQNKKERQGKKKNVRA